MSVMGEDNGKSILHKIWTEVCREVTILHFLLMLGSFDMAVNVMEH
jgi:hypothetical protein